MRRSLLELQRDFAASLRKPEPRASTLEAIVPGGRLSPEQALGVYRSSYVAQLTEALGETFEGVWRVLGDEDFFRVSREYVAGHPSKSPNLSDYGFDFPAYLARQRDFDDLPFLRELGEFEWDFKELFHQETPKEPGPDRFAAAERSGDIRLVFSPATRLRRHRYGTYAVWTHGREGGEWPVPWNGEERLLLYRKEENVLVARLDEIEYDLISRVRSGQPLSRALDAVARRRRRLEPEWVGALFSMLRRLRIVLGVLPVRPPAR
ncbi:MAG: DNA-binding domain-containing protein [Elusimicrobiota bacterium]